MGFLDGSKKDGERSHMKTTNATNQIKLASINEEGCTLGIKLVKLGKESNDGDFPIQAGWRAHDARSKLNRK
jgi:hypothetical protein